MNKLIIINIILPQMQMNRTIDKGAKQIITTTDFSNDNADEWFAD